VKPFAELTYADLVDVMVEHDYRAFPLPRTTRQDQHVVALSVGIGCGWRPASHADALMYFSVTGNIWRDTLRRVAGLPFGADTGSMRPMPRLW
jgi:hypothetical protein